MEVRETRVYRGPNIWTAGPAIALLLDPGGLGELNGLEIHSRLRCSLTAYPDQPHNLNDAAAIVGRIALNLQHMVGANVTLSEVRPAKQPGLVRVLYGYSVEEIGVAAGQLAVRLLNHFAAGAEPGLDIAALFETGIAQVAESTGYGPSTRAIVNAAVRRGIPISRPDSSRNFLILGQGVNQRRIWATTTDGTTLVAAYTAADKEMTGRLLEDAGIPVPPAVATGDVDRAVQIAERIGYPVVVKPVDGNHGRGVTLALADEEAVRAAFPSAQAASKGGRILVQGQVTGRDYRVLVIGNRVVAVAERIAAGATGDGLRSVRTMVDEMNGDPHRGNGHGRALTRIGTGESTRALLASQGLSWDDVPVAGRQIHLARTANLSAGGTAIDRTDEIHPSTAQIACETARVVGLDIAGIDIVTPDIARPLAEFGGAIIEVNTAPGFRMHTNPSEGEPRDVGNAVADLLFPRGVPARIPTVAVTGTNGKTTTTRMVAHLLRRDGRTVGLTTTDGIYIGDRQVAAGDMAGPGSARRVLRHPYVEVAALETARGGILREGLGVDGIDVGIVTNVASDHLGLDGVETLEDLARVKGVVPASVFPHGASILNADDPLVVAMAPSAGGELIYFSRDETNPTLREHVCKGGRALALAQTPDGETLRIFHRDVPKDLLMTTEIPSTLGGLLVANALNALAAAAAAWALGVSTEAIRAGLRTFEAGFATTPGRFNLIDVEGRNVVIDYAHNVAAMEAVGDFVQRYGAPRAVAMLAIPGDRSDEDSVALGKLAGSMFDGLVIREGNPRGRKPGESAALLKQGVLAAGMAEDEIRIVLDEVEAAHATVDHARPGDLAVIFVTRPALIWQELSDRAARSMAGARLSRDLQSG